MTEAVKVICEWGIKRNDVKSVIAEADLENLASQKILKGCGFKKYKQDETI